MRRDTDKISDARLEIRLTQEEKEAIRETAQSMGMNTSEFIRWACEQIFQKEDK